MGQEFSSTYRLQYNSDFTFKQAAAIVDYLARLGIGAVYSSPSLRAAPGSEHSYDVVDPTSISVEAGGDEGHRMLAGTIHDHGMGHILDIVPNHMAIGSPRNVWWWDVLENGQCSRYAHFFDIDWDPPNAFTSNAVLLPLLGDHYGRVLEAGELTIRREGSQFLICYYDHRFPLSPVSIPLILSEAAAKTCSIWLEYLSDAFANLALPQNASQEELKKRHRYEDLLKELLGQVLGREPELAEALDRVIAGINSKPERFDQLMQKQHYRLAYWRVARAEIGYRRFFDINSLVGLRVEDEEVFALTHELILKWLREGRIQGVRVDHIDGLRRPEQYLTRLRKAAPDAAIFVEKILMPGEELPESWPVQGTTGYDFLNSVNGLFVDPRGELPLTRFYASFTSERRSFREIALIKKRLVAEEILGGDINRLTLQLRKVCERHPRNRDYVWEELRQAVKEVLVSFPVYRSYVRTADRIVRRSDAEIIRKALSSARGVAQDLLDFLGELLLLRIHGEEESEFVSRFQQLSGPLTAKGVEDTAFYWYARLLSLNEVGGDPESFAVSPQAFHLDCMRRAARQPESLLATSTHDTKRGEDTRARTNVLSEMPEAWAAAVSRWAEHNRQFNPDGLLDRNTEYFIYQTLVGAWPLEKERALRYFTKCVKEAKQYTSWTSPDLQYEGALERFVTGILSDGEFRDDLKNFLKPVVDAGRINSLSQTLLKCTCPGIPDVYQGCELWSLTLVDPDNRVPVDFGIRREYLRFLENASAEEVMERIDEGLPKMFVLHRALQLRKQNPALLPRAEYRPLYASGDRADNLVAFMRGDAVITIVPRLTLSLQSGWGSTAIHLPAGNWHNVFTGAKMTGGEHEAAELLAEFPVALLQRGGET